MTAPGSISVAMATYNGARFIDTQLDSLAAQTRLPDELVVADDGSSDDTLARIAAFAERAPFPVRIDAHGERLGYRRNFMRAAARCTGDLIFFCDQDDRWLPAKIATMARLFDDPAVQLAYHNARVVDFQDRFTPFPLYDAGEEQDKVSPSIPHALSCFSLGFTQAYRRDLHRFDDLWAASRFDTQSEQPLAHDVWFFFLALTTGKIAYCDHALADYVQHEANAFGLRPPRRSRIGLDGLSNRFFGGADVNGAHVVETRSREHVLREIAKRSDPATGGRLLAIADRYAAFAQRWTLRERSHAEPRFVARVGLVLRNLYHGAYYGKPWRFRSSWLIGDIWRALIGTRSRAKATK